MGRSEGVESWEYRGEKERGLGCGEYRVVSSYGEYGVDSGEIEK